MERGGGKECGTGFEPDPGDVNTHLVEGTLQIRRRRDDDAVAAGELGDVRVVGIAAGRGCRVEAQDDRADAVAKIVEDLRVDLGRIGSGVLLADVPASQQVAQHLRPADEWRPTRHARGISARRTSLFCVDRLKFDALIGLSEHFLFEWDALQPGFDRLAPCRIVDPREVVPQRKILCNHG